MGTSKIGDDSKRWRWNSPCESCHPLDSERERSESHPSLYMQSSLNAFIAPKISGRTIYLMNVTLCWCITNYSCQTDRLVLSQYWRRSDRISWSLQMVFCMYPQDVDLWSHNKTQWFWWNGGSMNTTNHHVILKSIYHPLTILTIQIRF